MATVVRDLPDDHGTRHFVSQVGMAHWSVTLEACAVEALDRSFAGAEPIDLSPRDWRRVMDSVRAKAVRLRWYGGGGLTITASELVAPCPAVLDADGNEIVPPAWFAILPDEPIKSSRLRLVGA